MCRLATHVRPRYSEYKMKELDIEFEGTVNRVSESGSFGYILEPKTKRTYGFRFQDIPLYKGETAKELGLKEGVTLKFKLNRSGTVRYVKPPKPLK